MFNDKQEIIEILGELEWVWPLALWFKKLIILTSNNDLINLVYDVITQSIEQTKLDIDHEKKMLLSEKIKKIKKEESLKEDPENFLENNINII